MSEALDAAARAETVLTSLAAAVRVLREGGEGHA